MSPPAPAAATTAPATPSTASSTSFDLGIVLSVAFLLAALSSLDLTEAITGEKRSKASAPAPQTR
jgi:hypothetical protein